MPMMSSPPCTMFSRVNPQRVAHVLDRCFARTETFLYDFVCGSRRFEAWCLAERIYNTEEFPFARIVLTTIRWEGNGWWDLLDRASYRVLHAGVLPMLRALARVRPAILHAHFGPSGYRVLPYSRRLRIPLLTSFYGYDASSLPAREGWLLRLRELFRYGTAFAVEGPVMKRRLEALGCPSEKIHLVPITLHPERYRYRIRHLHPGEPLRLLFVGRFIPKKGLAILLSALACARSQLGACELRVIGGGDEEEQVRQLAERLDVADITRFLGFRARSTVIEEMDQAHVLAVPSRTAPDGDTEGGAPTILIEAQACGLPIVSTNHADIPFVVAGAYHEFLAAEGSVEEFAERLVALRRAADRWPMLAEAGLLHVQNQHGPDNFRRLEELYDCCIASV